MSIVSTISSHRVIGQLQYDVKEPRPNTYARNECDTNADTCCLGKNFTILNYTRRVDDVYAYDKSIKPIENVPIVSAATIFDDHTTGKSYVLSVSWHKT